MSAQAGPPSDLADVAGWYGKLPTVGDFASRRLEADFVDPWDRWLGDGLQAQRDALGDGWLDAFVHSPAWRFILSPGVLHGFDARSTLAGVVMPSVDRVGRYFPLTLAGAIDRVPATAAEFESVFAWIDRLENAALEALQNDWSIDDLEAVLGSTVGRPSQALSGPTDDPLASARASLSQALARGGGVVDVAPATCRAELASVFAKALAHGEPESTAPARRAELNGVAFWLADGASTPRLLVSTGLPQRDDFLHMFGGGGADEVDGGVPEPWVRSSAVASSPLGLSGDASELLTLFDGSVDAPVTDPLAHAAPREDILALFGATAESGTDDAALSATAPSAQAPHDELLALFDKAEAGVPENGADGAAARPDDDDVSGGVARPDRAGPAKR